jgi:RNA polymerase sigma-70 factor (ECF subfamily)
MNADLDTLLLNIAFNDDRKAYQTLFEQSYAPLCLFAGRFLSDRASREDIVQDVLFALWVRRKQLAFPVSAKSYLTAAVKNHCLNYLRRQEYHDDYLKEQLADEPYAAPDDLYNIRELYECLNRALDKLPEAYRLAFLLSRFEGRSATEIAAMMQVSVRTVERYRERALLILRRELKDYLPLLLALLC